MSKEMGPVCLLNKPPSGKHSKLPWLQLLQTKPQRRGANPAQRGRTGVKYGEWQRQDNDKTKRGGVSGTPAALMSHYTEPHEQPSQPLPRSINEKHKGPEGITRADLCDQKVLYMHMFASVHKAWCLATCMSLLSVLANKSPHTRALTHTPSRERVWQLRAALFIDGLPLREVKKERGRAW